MLINKYHANLFDNLFFFFEVEFVEFFYWIYLLWNFVSFFKLLNFVNLLPLINHKATYNTDFFNLVNFLKEKQRKNNNNS